jgi:hypothetical protein
MSKSRDSSVSIVTGSTVGGLIPGRRRDLYLLHGVQTSFGAHPVFCPMGTGGSFPGGKAAGDHSPPISAEVKNGGAVYLHCPISLHDLALNLCLCCMSSTLHSLFHHYLKY